MTVPVHQTILVVDVAGYSAAERTTTDVTDLKKGLHHALKTAFDGSGVPWDQVRVEGCGDGYFVLVPGRFGKSVFVERFPALLAEAVRVHNARHRRQAHMQLRMALHAGEVAYGEHGVTSPAINKTFSLVNAQVLRKALAESGGVLALAVSSWFFDEVVRPSAMANAASYRRVRTRTISDVAWIARPDDPYSPKKLRGTRKLRFW